jgi:hypothetical protein
MSNRTFERVLLCVGVSWLAILLLAAGLSKRHDRYRDAERNAGYMLRKGEPSDLTQDVIGFRAICRDGDAYPMLGPAMQKLGIFWEVEHISTHPPTAFLLVSPVGWMPVNAGARLWAWMMLAAVAGSFWCLGCSPRMSVGMALVSLIWPPVALCLGQLTAIWLLGVCVAYRCSVRSPAVSGLMLGLASATKIAPVGLLVLFVRRPTAIAAFVLWFALLFAILAALSPRAVVAYVQVLKQTVPQQSERPDNGSIVAQARHDFGSVGLAVSLVFLAVVLLINRQEIHRGSLVGWATLVYLSVAVLPILWVYSLVPLLFLGRWALLGGRVARFFFLMFILSSTVLPLWNLPHVLAGVVAWLGLGLIASRFESAVALTENISVTTVKNGLGCCV